jgi:hypothetical protein
MGLHVKYRLILSDFNKTLTVFKEIRKILKYQISRKSVQWEPICCMRTERQTNMRKLIVAFRIFEKPPKITNNLVHQCDEASANASELP